MKIIISILLCSSTLLGQDLQRINIGDLETTSGEVIRNCEIAFRTIGSLNGEASNVVLMPTWFMGSSEDNLNALFNMMDTTGMYIIVVDALGNSVSSSPSQMEAYPRISIRDMVNSQHQLLTRHLGIDHVNLIIGASMGGMQTFEWMLAYPEFMDNTVSIVGSPKSSFYDVAVWQARINLIEDAGKDEKALSKAMNRIADLGMLTTYTPAHTNTLGDPDTFAAYMANQYEYHANPADYRSQCYAIRNHDIYRSSGIAAEDVKDHIKSRVLVIVASQDHVVNPAGSREFAKTMGLQVVELTGDCGHISAWCEREKVRESIEAFLDN